MIQNLPRLIATWFAIAAVSCLAGVGVLALAKRLGGAPREFVAGPLWPRPDGSLPSLPSYRSFGLVWDIGEEFGPLDGTAA
jgi:hypothetical protein